MKMDAREKTNLKRIRRCLPECTVLLRSNGDFPLAEAGKLAVYGRGVRHTIKGGTGSGDVNSHFVINIEDGLEAAGFEITTKDWLDEYDEILAKAKKDYVNGLYKRALKERANPMMLGMGAVMPEPEYELPLDGEGDTAVYVLARICGEGNDRKAVKGDLLLTDTEIHDIQTLSRTYERFILVLNVGGPVDLSPLNSVENILLLSQLGVDTGWTLAQLLLGRVYPSGKLTTSWAAPSDLPSIGEFGAQDETCYREGIYVGYRYYDAASTEPLFPFGFGLSYTEFEIGNESVTADGSLITVTAEVENTGSCPGKEVLQLYISKPETKLDHPVKELIAYAKTGELLPGEKETVTISFPFEDAVSYDPKSASWIIESGDYLLRLGTSSADTDILSVLRVAEEQTVLKVMNALGNPGFEDWKPETKPEEQLPDDLDIIELDLSDLLEKEVLYDYKEDSDPLCDALSDEELAYLAIGNFSDAKGLMSIIGNAAQHVAGAAGETTSRFENRGLSYLVMADGPAGLRLNREYTVDDEGKPHGIGSALPSDMVELMPSFAANIMNRLGGNQAKKGQTIYNQYCTAIPIGTALAQSWNPAVPEFCGDVVGEEMELFGIQLWLAPALNIHRNILCGRNFEYYSEDPLISGDMAAAITRGVQKHPGRGTTIKHFAANNQERNRLANNSRVSERAMREIYLKGFEICIRDSQPKAIMTSYNLLNGTHTSERRDLNIDILRSEFGFKGLNMTDWVVPMMIEKNSFYPAALAWKTIKAGGNIFMPGTASDYKGVLTALENGDLTREELMQSALGMVRTVREFEAALSMEDLFEDDPDQ